MKSQKSDILWITADDISTLLTFEKCVELLEGVMPQVSRREATLPLRWGMPVEDKGLFGMMPGALDEPACFGIKLLSLYQSNPDSGLPSHLGLYVLYEKAYGQPIAIMDANVLTAIRTAAASALATKWLARPGSASMAMLGTGEQCREHIHAIRAVMPIEDIRIWGRDETKARQLAGDYEARLPDCHVSAFANPEDALKGADIVCTVTAAKHAFINEQWLEDGMHLNVVGSGMAKASEVLPECIKRAKLFIDYRESALAQAGDIIKAIDAGIIDESHILAEIGQVILGEKPGRTADTDITLYKSVGVAAQDLIVAHYLYSEAGQQDIGTKLTL